MPPVLKRIGREMWELHPATRISIMGKKLLKNLNM